MNELVEALEIAQQAFVEMEHARMNPRWFTKGESAATAHWFMWQKKGLESVSAALAAHEAQQAESEPVGRIELYAPAMEVAAPFDRVVWKDGRQPPRGTLLYTRPPAAIPDILFDGYAVYQRVRADDIAAKRTSYENVSDTLDAVVRLLREAP